MEWYDICLYHISCSSNGSCERRWVCAQLTCICAYTGCHWRSGWISFWKIFEKKCRILPIFWLHSFTGFLHYVWNITWINYVPLASAQAWFLLTIFFKISWLASGVIWDISWIMLALSIWVVIGLLEYTFFLKYTDRKKSRTVKSGDRWGS